MIIFESNTHYISYFYLYTVTIFKNSFSTRFGIRECSLLTNAEGGGMFADTMPKVILKKMMDPPNIYIVHFFGQNHPKIEFLLPHFLHSSDVGQ